MNVHQKAKAIRLWRLHYNTAEIGKSIKAPEYEVFNYLREVREEEVRGRPVDNVPGKVRKCLSCLTNFDSQGSGDRVCGICKRREIWNS
jgi:hypothetical protein